MRKGQRRRATVPALFVALSLVVAACGDDGDEASPSGDAGAAGNAGGSAELTGEPLRLMNISATTGGLPYPQVSAAAAAATEAINAAGGVDGRPVETVHCDTASVEDPNPATQCARDLIDDETFLAEVGGFGSFGDVTNPMLNEAGVPAIGAFPLSASVLGDPNAFPLAAPEGGAMALALADNSVEDIRVAYIDIPAGAESVTLADTFLDMGRGMSTSGSVAVPLDATDLSPQAAAAAEGEGAVVSLSAPQTVQFLRTVSEGGFDLALSIPGINLNDEQLELIAPYAEGVYVGYGLPPVTSTDLPGIERFHEEMDSYAPDVPRDEVALNAWMSVHAFATVASTIEGDITREAVLDAFSTYGNLDVFGLLPPDYDTTQETEVPGLERMLNRHYRSARIEDGQVVELADEWIPQLDAPSS